MIFECYNMTLYFNLKNIASIKCTEYDRKFDKIVDQLKYPGTKNS